MTLSMIDAFGALAIGLGIVAVALILVGLITTWAKDKK